MKKKNLKRDWEFYGTCSTGGIYIIKKKDKKKLKELCEIHKSMNDT